MKIRSGKIIDGRALLDSISFNGRRERVQPNSADAPALTGDRVPRGPKLRMDPVACRHDDLTLPGSRRMSP